MWQDVFGESFLSPPVHIVRGLCGFLDRHIWLAAKQALRSTSYRRRTRRGTSRSTVVTDPCDDFQQGQHVERSCLEIVLFALVSDGKDGDHLIVLDFVRWDVSG